MQVKELTRMEEFERCVELQRKEWGWNDLNIVPVRSFVVIANIGGLTLGAVVDNKVIGFINTLPGIRDGSPYWYSRMLGVDRGFWGQGVGTALKRAQRAHAVRRGVTLIEWTFDPLESKNAYLNLEKLGVIVKRYYVDHYGDTGSDVQGGLASDRLMAEWWLNKPRLKVGLERRHVTIPSQMQEIKNRDFREARRIQERVRRELNKHIGDGYIVVGFNRLKKEGRYVLVPETAPVYET